MPTSSICPLRIRIGADFCGQLTCCLALEKQGLATTIAWAAYKEPAVQKLINRNFDLSSAVRCLDVRARNVTVLPDCDLYVCTPPCTAFSPLNTQGKGPDDQETGQLSFAMLEVAIVKKPKAIVYENVPAVASHAFWTRSWMASAQQATKWCLDYLMASCMGSPKAANGSTWWPCTPPASRGRSSGQIR